MAAMEFFFLRGSFKDKHHYYRVDNSMKKGIIFIFIIISMVLTGCGMQSKTKTGKQELERKKNSLEAKAAENEYIKHTQESVEKINNGVDNLSVQLTNINFTDPYWVGKVRMNLNHIRFAVDDYLKSEITLSTYKENFNHYNKTRNIMDKGTAELQTIIKETDEALDTANREKIQVINSRFESENEKIKKGLEQLESDQNQKN
jgi:major membrane immunogen (membrane-anchored lipoprotein)